MRAMLLTRPRTPLVAAEIPIPEPGPGQLLLRVEACAVCRTDLHVRDGELTRPKLPLVLGHEIVGTVTAAGPRAEGAREISGVPAPGTRVGVPWLASTCGACGFCLSGRENLCDSALFTGYTVDGGYAEWAVADARYAFPIPAGLASAAAAPLLCAGLIGYRTLRMAGDARRVGLYGFGAAAHILCQVAAGEGREVYAFTKGGDTAGQEFAKRLGAVWAGGSGDAPPLPLDAALVFAPVGALVPAALRAVAKGGTVVCGGIHMSDIPAFPYELLWGERTLRSVANLTRRDGVELFELLERIPVRTEVVPYPLAEANRALDDLHEGRLVGAAVLLP